MSAQKIVERRRNCHQQIKGKMRHETRTFRHEPRSEVSIGRGDGVILECAALRPFIKR